MQFTYRAKQDPRTEASGVVEAVDRAQAVAHLKGMGLFPLEVVPLEPRRRSPQVGVSSRRPLSRAVLSLWARTVGQGLKAGLSLTQALHLLAEQEPDRPAGQAAGLLEKQVTAGMGLADAMGQMGSAFPPVSVSLARAGEIGGALEEILESFASQVEAEAELIGKVRGALVYPLFVLTVGIATVGILVWGVLPRLTLLFAEAGQSLPMASRLLIGFGKGMVLSAAAGVLVGGLGFWISRRTGWRLPVGRWGTAILSRLPWFGRMIRQSEIARLAATLGLLLEHGISLPEALRLGAGTTANPTLKGQLQRIQRDVMEGLSVSEAFRRAGIKESFLLTMIAMGEAQGDLARSFNQAGARYHQEVDRIIKTLSTLIEPMMILVVGLIVGGIVFSMLLPIFQINFTVG